ncbi:MAG: zinc ABC transporter substrate-binding protein [Pirellula sp.]|nr:zinc ABC transporter substrate-binding protein [Pirellula sp.]
MNTNRRRWMQLAALGSPGLLISGCWRSSHDVPDGDTGASPSGALPVVATTGMIADMVRSIGGDAVQLTQLIPAGVDPHLYKPIRDDVVAIVHSKIVFYNGLKLEGRMSDVLAAGSKSQRVHVALSDALDPSSLIGEPSSHEVDPHIWMDVSMWSKTIGSIRDTLGGVLVHHRERLDRAAGELIEQLEALDRYGKEAIGRIPKPQRILISSHDAFQYFGRRYGLRVEGVQGISTASEAGLQRIPELIELIRENSVPAVFKESSVGGKMIDAVIEGAASRRIELRVGKELYSDALGPVGSGAETYIGMMKHNFDAVAEALSAGRSTR